MVTTTNSLSFSARAVVADAISRGFSYPVSDFYADLVSGEFVRLLQQGCGTKNRPASIVRALSELEAGIAHISGERARDDLGSEYIGLFEHNHRQTPLHLYGGLYLQNEGGRLETLQRLSSLYQSCGLEMEDGAEHADHLTVVLEFLGFLYRQYEPLLAEGDEEELRQLRTHIRATVTELSWSKRLDQELTARDGHPFYLPLSRLLQSLLLLPEE